jgi:hypothetical protein
VTETASAGLIDPRTGRVDVVERFRQWVEAGRPPLIVDDTAPCTTDVDDPEEGPVQCARLSRYIVERSDFDASFGALGGGEEACEGHLQETVDWMIDGSSDKTEIRAVVTIRWNKP